MTDDDRRNVVNFLAGIALSTTATTWDRIAAGNALVRLATVEKLVGSGIDLGKVRRLEDDTLGGVERLARRRIGRETRTV